MTRVVCDVGQPRRMETCGAEEPYEGNLHVRFCGGIGRVIADPTRTPDCLQRPLLRRARFQPRLAPGVRGAADKAAHLMGCKSPYRPLPDADGAHIRGIGRSQPLRGSEGKVTAALWWKPSREERSGWRAHLRACPSRTGLQPRPGRRPALAVRAVRGAALVRTRGRPLAWRKQRGAALHEPPGEGSTPAGKEAQRARRAGPPPRRG